MAETVGLSRPSRSTPPRQDDGDDGVKYCVLRPGVEIEEVVALELGRANTLARKGILLDHVGLAE